MISFLNNGNIGLKTICNGIHDEVGIHNGAHEQAAGWQMVGSVAQHMADPLETNKKEGERHALVPQCCYKGEKKH